VLERDRSGPMQQQPGDLERASSEALRCEDNESPNHERDGFFNLSSYQGN